MSGTATTKAPIWPRVDDRTCAAAPAWCCVVQRSSHHTPRPPASPTVAAVPTRRPRRFGAVVDGRRRRAPPIRDKALQPAPARGAIGGSELLGSFYTRPTPSASQGLRVSGPRANRARKEEPMRRPVSNSAPPARGGSGFAWGGPGEPPRSAAGHGPHQWNAVWEPTTSRINPMVAGLSTRQS
jgi:hypothetical protein